jgi:hypothetical protein
MVSTFAIFNIFIVFLSNHTFCIIYYCLNLSIIIYRYLFTNFSFFISYNSSVSISTICLVFISFRKISRSCLYILPRNSIKSIIIYWFCIIYSMWITYTIICSSTLINRFVWSIFYYSIICYISNCSSFIKIR